jgi:orotidine-5'-phosphate decarboxylase
MIRNPIFCAIDTPDRAQARALIAQTSRSVGGIKLGLEFFTANGPRAVREVAPKETVFLDLKLHDIPNTVAGAVRAVAAVEPAFLTVHAAGGPAMLRAAAEAAKEGKGQRKMKLLAITVLTSLDEGDLEATGQRGPIAELARRLALLARDCGIDGAVCSPREVAQLRAACGPDFVLVVPGIRALGASIGDQKRVSAPRATIDAGADYLVIGRPITEAPDPGAAARALLAQLK